MVEDGVIDKLLYIADYMEPNRDFPEVEELRRLAYSSSRSRVEDTSTSPGMEMVVILAP